MKSRGVVWLEKRCEDDRRGFFHCVLPLSDSVGTEQDKFKSSQVYSAAVSRVTLVNVSVHTDISSTSL